MSRRKWFAWHSWIGLTAGLMLFVICWSGTVAVFSYEIDWLLNPHLRVTGSSPEMRWEAIRTSAEAAFPNARVTQIARPHAEGYAAEVLLLRPAKRMWRVYADPHSGRILGDTSYFNVRRFFRSFHMNLFFISADFDLGYWGFRLVESFALVLLGSLATSLVFYRRWWRGFLKLERRRGARIFWSDLHKLTGLRSMWFVVVIAITGIWYFVEEFVPGSPEAPELPRAPVSTITHPTLDALIEKARATVPGYEVSRVWLSETAPAPVEVYGYDGALLVRDRASKIWLDPRDASVIDVQRTSDLNALERWIDTADPIHFGTFAGLWSKTLWFVFGLALSAMALTGAYLQAMRQKRRHFGGPVRRAVLGAYLTTLAILLVASVGGWFEIRSYGMPVDGASSFPAVSGPVVAFLSAWVAVTFAALSLWMWKVR